MAYGYMRGVYSGRGIEAACRRDICFMWLLNGEPAPDNTTLSRFQNEKLEEYLERSEKYEECFKKFKGRKSYSKTDEDATFMRMKEDHMRNGQLKPAYNVQIGVEAEYIIGVGLFPNPTDVKTFIPFLERVKTGIRHKILNIIADAGYESEENYVYLKNNEQTAYIKPQNYETSKKRAYKKDKFRVEHLEYDSEKDCFICPNGCELKFIYEKESTT